MRKNNQTTDYNMQDREQVTDIRLDPQVIIPYSQLCDLLNAAVELKHLRKEIKRLENNQATLRWQFVELMEKLKEIY